MTTKNPSPSPTRYPVLVLLVISIILLALSSTQAQPTPAPSPQTKSDSTTTPPREIFAPIPTAAHPVAAALKLSADSLKPGEKFEARVQVRVFSPFHIYGLHLTNDLGIPTSFALTLPPEVEKAGEWIAPKPTVDKDGSLIYTDTVDFKLPLRLRANAVARKYVVAIKMTTQACNDRLCLAPADSSLTAPLTAAP